MKNFLTLGLLFTTGFGFSQPNCNIYKMNSNEPCYKACTLATEGEEPQGSKESQIKYDEAIALCPTFDYAYREKSVPYLKRGDFITWKKLIDKAVELNPMDNLGYRGWCSYQFVRDYQGAIDDFEKLNTMTSFEIGYSANGDYQLNIAKALCYKAIGQREKAIAIIKKQLATNGYSPQPYDYLHLGVLKMETDKNQEAIECFKKSISVGDYLAEAYYYLGLIYKRQGDAVLHRTNMEKAKEYYLKGHKLFDPYTQPMDKIYLASIEAELK
jgi:tetratricopeptide (TPR) repeat protein